tara:strand:- start:2834 stop:3829 length:996 start_codon:yes stop_codon:yes gene_type:complete
MNQNKPQSNKHKILIEKLRNLSFQSDNKSDKQIIKEWEPNGIIIEADPDNPNHFLECACTHPTCKTLNIIKNIHNGHTLDVGSRCIKKFEEINPDWEGGEQIKNIRKEKKEEKIKELLKKHDIELSKEYYITYQRSVVKCKIKPKLKTLQSQLQISFNAFGSRQSVGKMTLDIKEFKDKIVTEEKFNEYNTLKDDISDKMDIQIGGKIQGKKIKDVYCDEDGHWIVLFTDKTTKTETGIFFMKKKEILKKIEILTQEIRDNGRVLHFSYLHDIDYFLQRYNLSSILELKGEKSSKFFNQLKGWNKSWIFKPLQKNWINDILERIRKYIKNL